MNRYNFRINGTDYTIVNEWKKTRNGFKHESTLLNNTPFELMKVKVNYINRTWERFQFESSMKKLVKTFFTDNGVKAIYIQLGIESL
jgi:hypothetical protein